MAEKGMTMAEFLQNTTQEQRNEIYNASASGNSEKVKQLTSNIGSNRGSGQSTSAASRGSSGNSAWKKGSIPKGFVKNPLTFASGIQPVDTRPSVVSKAREPFEYAAQQRQKEAEIQDLNQKYKQAYLDYNSARRAVTAASKGKSTANYDVAKSKMTEASELVDAYKKRVEEAGGTLWTPTNWLDTVKWSARAGLTSADSAIAKGLDWAVGGFADELRTLAGVTANDISPALADSAANLATKAGRLINPNYTYGENNFLKQYVDEGNRRINVQHEEMARAASDSKAAQTVGKYTEMIMNSLPMSAMALLSGGTTAAAQATTEALQAASTLANSSRAAQIVTPILKATTDMAKDPNWGFTFMSVVGDSYENALADGASEDQASLYAILNAAYNATTEIGGSDEMLGGLQKLPKNIRDALERADNSVLLQIVKGIPSEIGEEIVQGIGESGLKSTYKNVPLYSATDEGAMINPSRMKDEALGAAVVSAVLGGGQSAIGAGTYAIENGIAQRQYRNKVAQAYGSSAAELVESGLESAPGTKSRTLAETYKAKLDSGKSLTPRELTNLVKANEEAIRAEVEEEISAVQETVDTSEAATSPAQTQSATEEQGLAQSTASTQTAEEAPTGVYEAKYKGQTGDVVAFARQGDSFALRIKMPDGSKPDVMESQVTLDPATREMLDTVRPYDYGDEILTSYRAAENGDNFKLFTQAFSTAADLYGKETTVTAEQAYADSVKNGGAATVLTREQFNKAFDIGRSSRDARVVNTAARQRGSGNVYFNKVVDFGGVRYAAATEDMVNADELSVIKTIAKTAGVDVVFYQSETDMSGRYVGANGFMRNGTMYLDVNAGATKTTEQSAVLLTAAHELTHYIRENNAEGYAQLRDFVTQHLIENGVGIEKLAEQKIAREGGTLSMDEAVEEVIADSCETMLEDTKFPELMAKENPGLCEQIRDWLADFTEKLRRAFSGVKARHEEARAMLNYAEELHELWDNALVAAVRNTETVSDNGTRSGSTRYSIREIDDTGKYYVKADRQVLFGNDPKAWGEQLTRYINREIRSGRDVLLTAADGEVIKLTATTAEKGAFRNVWYDSKGAAHLLTDAEYEAKLNAEAHIDEIVKTSEDKHKGRPNTPDENNLHGDVAKDGWRYRRAYFMDHDGKYYDLTLSVAYGRDGKVAYNIANMRERSFPTSPGSSNPKTGAQSGKASPKATIPQPNVESNTKYSMRERDDRQAAIQRELNQLKEEKKKLLNENAEYAAAVEQRRYAETFTERVAASKALKSAEAKVDTAEIDARIEMLLDESAELREQERAEYNAAKEKYSGAKTKGYSQYADTRTGELDEEYSRAVTARDETRMQELVLEAAERAMPNSVIRDENGKLKPVYHYTNNSFTVFDRSKARTGNEMDGFFFAPDPESTTEYGERRVTAFLNITNPAYDPYLDRKHNDSGTLLREKLAYEGYDGVIRTEDGKAYEYMAFDPEQIKSAEPVTYDDAGKVIPLSERFNSSSDDIRYSRRDVGLDDTTEQRRGRQESYADLRRRNAELERRVQYWREQTRTSKEATVRQTDTDAFARQLMNDAYNSDRETLGKVKDSLKGLGDYIVQSRAEDLDYATIHEIAAETADMILQGSYTTIDDTNADNLKQLHDYLHSTKLAMNEREMLDLPEGWRQKNRGNIKLSKDGLPVDTAYGELQGMFGEGTFPSDITSQADMLQRIADVERAWRPVKANPFTEYMAEMRENMAQEIIDTMLSDEIRQTPPTAMDRAVARETERVAGERRKNRELQQRIAQVQQEGIERTRKAVQDERRYQLQRQERAQKVKNIEKMTTRWAKQLTDNTGKSHIPDALKQPIGQLIRSIDPTTKYTTAKGSAALADRLRRVGDALEKQQKYNMGDTAEGGADVYIDLPPEIGSRLREYAKDIEDAASIRREWKLEDMDLQELAELENLLTSVRDSLKHANELYSMNMKADALGDETVKYLNKLPAKTKAAKGTEKFLGYTNQTPVYFFKRFGTGGEKVFKSLADGWEDFAFKAKAIREFAEKLYNSKEVREAEQTIVQVQLHDKLANGLTNEETVPVYMTKAQIMCLYGATLRGEAALNHILGAGIKLTDIKQPRGKDTITQSDNYLTTAEELESIINDNLSEREKEIVRGMIKFMSTTCASWGNAVSQKRWGINLFTEDSYWPISTDSRSRDVKSGEAAGSSTSMYRLANMGFTKPLTPGSRNPMVIGSAFDVFANHTSDMAKYGSMVLPILDAMKWINYSATMETSGTQYTTASVRKAMDRAYGEDAQNYFVKLMRDLNGSKEGGRDTNGLEAWTARYKRQAVSGNLRVMLLQPTAYARAGMVIDPKYLVAGAIGQHEVIKNYREAIANSGTALWKSMGFFDVNINASMRDLIKNDESAVDKIVDWTMKGAELGDQWTWSMIWRACRTEQQDKARKTGEKLTHEELMQRTAERFQEVIYQTQVMDSTLTRSQIMRSNDKLNKALTSFMAEPTLTYNTLSNTYLEYQRLKGAEGAQAAWKKCGGRIARALGVYTVSAALQAVVESIPDAWRDDDEYMTFMEKWLEKFWGEDSFLDGNLASELNPLNKLPVIKDLLNALEGHSSTNMSTEGLSSAVKFLNTFWDKIQYWLGETDGSDIKVTDWGWIYQGLKAVSQLAGIPGYNVVRDVVGVWNSTFGTWTDMRIRTYAARPESEIKNAYLKGYLTDEEAKELLMDAKTMGENVYWTEHAATVQINDWAKDSGEVYADLYTAMENDDRAAYDAAFKTLTDTGRYAYDVQSKVKEQIKEWYAGDKRGKTTLNKEQTVAMLKEYGGMTDHDAEVTAQQWTCKKVEGFDYSQRKKLFLSGDIDKTEAVRLIKTYGVDDDGKLLADYKDKTKANAIAEKEVREWSMITEQGIDYDDMRDAYNAGEITLAQVKEWSMKYGSEDEKTADNKCYRWEWIAGSEELKGTTGAQARRYDTYIAAANVDMTKEQYYNYIDGHGKSTFSADYDSNGRVITNSKRAKAWAYIDSLPITAAQKDALAMCYFDDVGTKSWAKLEEAPWNN